ncbi:hypothetical protein ABPG72_014818 [Tetrahymena utriculariae]
MQQYDLSFQGGYSAKLAYTKNAGLVFAATGSLGNKITLHDIRQQISPSCRQHERIAYVADFFYGMFYINLAFVLSSDPSTYPLKLDSKFISYWPFQGQSVNSLVMSIPFCFSTIDKMFFLLTQLALQFIVNQSLTQMMNILIFIMDFNQSCTHQQKHCTTGSVQWVKNNKYFYGVFDDGGIFIMSYDSEFYNMQVLAFIIQNPTDQIDYLWVNPEETLMILGISTNKYTLEVFDITEKTKPKLITQITKTESNDTDGCAFTKDMKRLICANGGDGIFITDISDISNLKILFTWPLESFMTGTVKDVVIKDNKYILGTIRNYGRCILELTDPNTLVLRGYLQANGGEGIALSNDLNYVYFKDGINGVTIVDIQNLPKVTIVGQVQLEGKYIPNKEIAYNGCTDSQENYIMILTNSGFRVGQTIRFAFLILYPEKNIKINQILQVDNYEIKHIPYWMTYSSSSQILTMSILKEVLGSGSIQKSLNSVIIQTLKQISSGDFVFNQTNATTTPDQSTSNYITSQSSTIIIYLLIDSALGKFVSLLYGGVITLITEKLEQIKLEGSIENINRALQFGIFISRVDFQNDISVLVTVQDGINYDVQKQLNVKDVCFIQMMQSVKQLLANNIQISITCLTINFKIGFYNYVYINKTKSQREKQDQTSTSHDQLVQNKNNDTTLHFEETNVQKSVNQSIQNYSPQKLDHDITQDQLNLNDQSALEITNNLSNIHQKKHSQYEE